MTDTKRSSDCGSATRLLGILVVTIFVTECLIMLLLEGLPHSRWGTPLLDAALLGTPS